MQAALDIPMTVYGTGGQTRGFIHVTDTAKCLEAAVVNPPPSNGPVEIFNQVTFFFNGTENREIILKLILFLKFSICFVWETDSAITLAHLWVVSALV